MVSVRRKTQLPLFELRSKAYHTGRKEDREGLTPIPKVLLWQMAVAHWRQPFVPFHPSCGIHNSSEARTMEYRQYSCERSSHKHQNRRARELLHDATPLKIYFE